MAKRNYNTPGVRRSLLKKAKYRAKLNKTRRKNGIYGKGGKDVSHGKGGTYTMENKSKNRSRNGNTGGSTKSKKRGRKLPYLRKKRGRPKGS